MTLVKICGIRELQHAQAAAEASADLIGLVFVPVRRQIAPDEAAKIIQEIRSTNESPPAAVGLFVNESAATINSIVDQVQLDFVQLSGDESPELAAQIDVPVIKAVRVRDGMSADDLRRTIDEHLRYSVALLLDSHVKGHWGGTGIVGDWELAAGLAAEYPLILAGGLSPENVSQAIQQVNPAVVDVSSGVEIEGRKDAQLISRFVTAAREADRSPQPLALHLTTLIENLKTARNRSAVK